MSLYHQILSSDPRYADAHRLGANNGSGIHTGSGRRLSKRSSNRPLLFWAIVMILGIGIVILELIIPMGH